MKKILYLTATAALLTAATVSCKETPIVKETKVTGVRLNKTELTLIVGETDTLIASVLPEDADNKAVSWESSDNDIVAVDDNGNITAKEVGTALITATTKDGGKTASCSVTVFCNCIMDTLKGEWSWVKEISGWLPIRDNSFKSVLKMLSQNTDGSINYEVFLEDTLFFKGSFQYYYDENNVMITDDIMLYSKWKWYIYFRDWNYWKINKDFLCFWDGGIDGSYYYYQKINKEE